MSIFNIVKNIMGTIDESNDIEALNYSVNEFGQSLLHLASYDNNYPEIIKEVENCTDLNIRDKRGKTALHYCAMNNNYEAVLLLLAKNARTDIEDNFGNHVLWDAVLSCHGDFRIVEELLLCTGDMNHKNINDQSVLDAVKIMDDYEMNRLFRRFRY